jgi:hypothetical protein
MRFFIVVLNTAIYLRDKSTVPHVAVSQIYSIIVQEACSKADYNKYLPTATS